jgi:hypothetical protein
MLPALVALALTAFAAALALEAFGIGVPALSAHTAFALGIMPLVLAAIGYFVPVLTRSGGPPAALRLAPLAALAGALLAVAGFALPVGLSPPAAVGSPFAFAAALGMSGWIVARGRRALGAPHPGLRWYLAACGCLALAMAATFAMPFWPQQHWPLRLLHLHLNLLGFVGLTAVGTLQVLLPTAAGRPDPGAAGRLRRDLPFALAGVLLVAFGAAWWPPASHVGALLLLLPLARMGWSWWRLFRAQLAAAHGAAPALALAGVGLALLLGGGMAHGAGLLAGRAAVAGFAAAFLLPLVSGAATQLLPVWLRPGVQSEWHRQLRQRLGRGAALRAGAMVLGGLSWTAGLPQGLWLAGAGVLLFAAVALPAVILALRQRRPPK